MVSDASRKRLLRLFLSSTFHDMQIERDILARLVLPRQRAMLAGHGAALQEVDLRWGVTAAMASGGGALAVCLRQVAECFPLVLGLLGRRSGGAPPRGVVEKFDPTFAEPLPKGASFTEAEMRYAVYLARHKPDVKLLIMVRSDRLSAEIASDPAEWAAGEAFRSWALTSLAVRAVEYDSFDQFERRVDQELERVLRAEATRKNSSSVVMPGLPELDRSRELAALSRAAARRRPTLVKSEGGIGVSWLARRWVSSDPHGLYVDGRGLAALDLAQTLRSPEDAERGDAPDEPRGRELSADQSVDQRTMALMARMSGPPAARRIVFDHYEDGFVSEARADLAWIPTKLPRGCSVVVITRGERRLEAQARDLGWQLHTVERIDPWKAAEFAIQYLEVFGKHLAPDQLGILKSAPWTTNFASLILALDELRRHGAHETLTQRLTELASHANGPGLVEELVAGLTSVMPKEWRAAVEDAMLAIRMSVRGLEEHEVRAAVGAVAAFPASNSTLPSYLWSAIQISLGSALVTRGTLIDLSGGPLLEWVNDLFLTRHDRVKRVAAAMNVALEKAPAVRRWTEAAQLAQVRDPVSGLERLLEDPTNVQGLISVGETFADGWLARLSPETRRRVMTGWQAKLMESSPEAAWPLGLMAARAGEIDIARHLIELDAEAGPQTTSAYRPAHADERESLLAFLRRDGAALARLAERLIVRAFAAPHTLPNIMTGLAVLGACANGDVELDRKLEDALTSWLGSAIRRCGQPLLEAQLQIYSGQLLLNHSRRFTAVRTFAIAERAARQLGHARLLCQALERLAAVQLERNRFRSARQAAIECRELAFRTGLADFEAMAFERQIEVERRRANWSEAFELAEAYLARCREGLGDVQHAKTVLAMLNAPD